MALLGGTEELPRRSERFIAILVLVGMRSDKEGLSSSLKVMNADSDAERFCAGQ